MMYRHRPRTLALLFLSGLFPLGLLTACSEAPDSTVLESSSVTAFQRIAVLPIEPAGVLPDQTVLVENGRISSIGPADQVEIPTGALVLDGAGRYLIPGLAEMHGHPMTEEDLLVYLANGVTWMRALWGEPSLLELRDRVEKGEVDGPSLSVAGRIIDGQAPIHYATVALDDPAEALAVLSAQQDAGYDYAKIYSGMSLEVFEALDDASKQLGFPFAGHAPIEVPIERILTSGMRTTEHMFGYLAAVQADSVPANLDAAFADPTARAYVERIGRGEIDVASLVDPAKTEDLVESVAASDLALVPTLAVHEAIVQLGSKSPPEARYQNVAVQHFWRNSSAMMSSFSGPDLVAGNRALFDLQMQLVGELHDGGATILVGTDAPNPNVPSGFAVARELELLVAAGLSREQALRAATYEAARFAGDELERGHIKPGAIADLVVLTGNPLDDLTALRDPVGVMHGGRWYDGDDLRSRLEDVVSENERILTLLAEAPSLQETTFTRTDFLAEDGRQLAMITDMQAPAATSDTPSVRVDGAFRSGPDQAWQHFELSRDSSGSTLVLGEAADAETSMRLETDGDTVTLSRNGQLLEERASIAPPGVSLLLTGTEADLVVAHSVLRSLRVGDDLDLQAWSCADHETLAIGCDEPRVESWTVTRRADQVLDGHFYYTGSRAFEITETSNPSQVIGTWFIGGGGYEGQAIRMLDLRSGREPLRRVR